MTSYPNNMSDGVDEEGQSVITLVHEIQEEMQSFVKGII